MASKTWSSRDRVRAALSHERPDRVPFNFWMDRRLMARYAARYGEYFRITHFGADVLESFPGWMWPAGPTIERDGTVWHVAPLVQSLAEVLDLPVPDPTDDAVYDPIRADRARFPDVAIFVDVVGPLTILHGMRLYQNLFLDIYDSPEVLEQIIRRWASIYAALVERLVRLDIDAIYLMDDIAGRDGLMLSREHIRQTVFACFAEPIAIAHAAGLPVLFHSDGDLTAILDDLVELGFDAVNPLEPPLNDLDAFRARYRGQLAVYGGLDTYGVIPNGTPADVRRHVLRTFETLGPSGGLILSTHDIPIHTPEANIEAMVETIRQECRYQHT
ncbi:MAG TPA: hypothetical protein G4O02_04795 [Caldilineae bacterium]|nr:hypothetical protein [Caldilineae bacterium]